MRCQIQLPFDLIFFPKKIIINENKKNANNFSNDLICAIYLIQTILIQTIKFIKCMLKKLLQKIHPYM